MAARESVELSEWVRIPLATHLLALYKFIIKEVRIMRTRLKIFQEGWMFLLVSVFDSGLTYVLIKYHGYGEENPFMSFVYHALGENIILLIVFKLILSFIIVFIICWIGRKRELLARDFLRIASIIYFLSLVFIMIILPELVYLFILLRFKL